MERSRQSKSPESFSEAKEIKGEAGFPDVQGTSSIVAAPQSKDSQPAFHDFEHSEGKGKSKLSTDHLAINRSPGCNRHLPPLRSDPSHAVLFDHNITSGEVPKPYPLKFRDCWDQDHVRMPCSPSSIFKGTKRCRWDIIEQNLRRPMTSCSELTEAILSYNPDYKTRWGFQELNQFFQVSLEPVETRHFFSVILPKMVDLALQLPTFCTSPIPLLKTGMNLSITFSQQQISCLLANAFFCTFPERYSRGKKSEYATYPDINFNGLFGPQRNCKAEKLKCLFNYFKRVTQQTPTGTVTFERRCCEAFPKWDESHKKLRKLYMMSEGVIEDDGSGLLQVDFADMMVGGLVFDIGCVQEEIRFVICPELILSRLFTERLSDSEVLVVTGCERFSSYSGYIRSFAWEGDFKDDTPRDSWERICTQVVAMDATRFRDQSLQYNVDYLTRELNKAFCAFNEPGIPAENITAVATGNWGCGVFKGDPKLKTLVQLLAASQSDRDLVYFTFGDDQLGDEATSLYNFLSQKGTSVGQLWSLLKRFKNRTNLNESLYFFIRNNTVN